MLEDRQKINMKYQTDFQLKVAGQTHNISELAKRTEDIDDLLKWKTAYIEIQRDSKKELTSTNKDLSKRIENLEKTF
jgi:hypothetical protein